MFLQLERVARDHVSLLRLLEESGVMSNEVTSASSSFDNAFFMRRMGLNSEEAQAINCLEFRDRLVIKYLNNKTVVTGGSFAIVYEKAKVYSAANVVVDDFLISNIKEMYHDEAEHCLRIEVAHKGLLEIHCPLQASLRSIYYTLLLRHHDYTSGNQHFDPLMSAEAALNKGQNVRNFGEQSQSQSLQQHNDLRETISRQQQQIDQLSRAQSLGRHSVSPPQPSLGRVEQSHHSPAKERGKGASYLLLGKRPSVRSARRTVLCCCEYASSPHSLPGGVQKMNCLSDFLCARGFGGEKVTLSDADKRALPTRYNIVKALKWLVDGAKPGDALFFAFIGHGGQLLGSHGAPEGICPSDYAECGVVPGEEIRAVLRVPSGVRLTILSDLGGGGSIVAMPWSVLGSSPLQVLDGGRTTQPGTTLVVSSLKDSAGGKESVASAYCKAMNYLPEPTAAQLVSAMAQAMAGHATTPVLSSYTPLPPTFNASLGAHQTEFIDAEGPDRDALHAYHNTDVGAWIPPRVLDTAY